MEGRAATRERLLRADGRDVDVAQRSKPLCRRLPVGVAAARWTGDCADQPSIAARDAATVAAWRHVSRSRSGDTAPFSSRLAATRFGLGVSQTCSFRHIVAHSGGLPGFGSLMRWLPEYGVGIIAFGNLTYTGWGRVDEHGIRSPGEDGRPQAAHAAAVAGARRRRATRCRSWSSEWDDRARGRDRRRQPVPRPSKDRRRAEIEQLRAKLRCVHGAGNTFDEVENALRGTLDDELRARKASSVDHARADDAAACAIPVGEAGACRTDSRHLSAVEHVAKLTTASRSAGL